MAEKSFTDERVIAFLGWRTGPTISVKENVHAEWASVEITEHNIENRNTSIEITEQEARWLVTTLSGWLQELDLVKAISAVE